MSILEQFGAREQVFTPSSVHEFVALQLAKRLQDAQNLKFYLHHVERYGADVVFRLYGQVANHPAEIRAEHLRNFILNHSATP